jgi:prepilin-type N-terminal cleavage/methylation domain-containing protein
MSDRRRGFTLVEVIIALGISVTAVAAITTSLIYTSRVVQSNLSQLHAGEASRRFYDHIAEHTRSAVHIAVASNGLSVTITQSNGRVESYSYADADSNPSTVNNNRIVFDPNTSVGGDQETLVGSITPGSQGWIFQPNTPRPLLNIAFRIGDPVSDPFGPSNAFTGPGVQGVDVTSQLTPRNLHLWGG